MIGASYDRDEVQAALAPSAVLSAHGVDFRRSGKELRFRTCPECGERGRSDAVAVNAESGLWDCKGRPCSGDIFDMVAGFEGLNASRDFPEVLARAAELAGVEPRAHQSPEERAERERRRKAAQAAQRAREAEQRRQGREQARAIASKAWPRLERRHERGEDYLRRRGLGELVGRDDLVRYDRAGNVAVLARGVDGDPQNVVTRYLDPAPNRPKVRGEKGCCGLGMFGVVRQLETTAGAVFLVEGVFDWLTCEMLVRPHGNLAIGAHGADNLPKLAAAIGPMLAAHGRRFCLAVHEDEAGGGKSEKAIEAALAAGVVFDPETDLFNLGGAADLNAALQKGCGDVREYV